MDANFDLLVDFFRYIDRAYKLDSFEPEETIVRRYLEHAKQPEGAANA